MTHPETYYDARRALDAQGLRVESRNVVLAALGWETPPAPQGYTISLTESLLPPEAVAAYPPTADQWGRTYRTYLLAVAAPSKIAAARMVFADRKEATRLAQVDYRGISGVQSILPGTYEAEVVARAPEKGWLRVDPGYIPLGRDGTYRPEAWVPITVSEMTEWNALDFSSQRERWRAVKGAQS